MGTALYHEYICGGGGLVLKFEVSWMIVVMFLMLMTSGSRQRNRIALALYSHNVCLSQHVFDRLA